MFIRLLLLIHVVFTLLIAPAYSQKPETVAGPMVGSATDSMSNVWVLVREGNKFATHQILITPEQNGYQGFPTGDRSKSNFSFLFGSCAYRNDKRKFLNFMIGPNRFKIYEAMTKTSSDFMLWLGDNIYYEDGEWFDYDKMFAKNVMQRMDSRFNDFIKSRPQYAIWDDHDFGPDNSNSSFSNKETSLQLFQQFWANPYYGTPETPGVFHHFSWNDVDFFMTDGRYHLNPEKEEMFGPGQMKWLKEHLLASKATFKIIGMGTQALSASKLGETYKDYPKEYNELLDFLKTNSIKGVVFLSGDRHNAEITRLDRPGTYPLYDLTSSGLSSLHFPAFPKVGNKLRIKGTYRVRYNYARVVFEGEGSQRLLRFELYNNKGRMLYDYAIYAKDLQ